jgi:threonine dehydrogenase-like Zn-dependent dehydrogenase
VIYGLHRSELRFGERVVIQGAGGLGLFAAAVAREMGAAQIIVVDAVAERLKLAVRFGADEVVDINEFPAPADRIRQIRRRTDGGADVVLGVAGIGPAFTEGIDMTGTTGRMVEIGIIDLAARVELAPAKLTYGNRQVIGVSLYEPWALERAVHFLADAAGRYPFDALATVPYPLAKLEQALADAAERKVQRPSIRPWS